MDDTTQYRSLKTESTVKKWMIPKPSNPLYGATPSGSDVDMERIYYKHATPTGSEEW